MFFKKFVNSKFYYILDQIVRVIWLNLITLFFIVAGLVLFSFGPAILSGVYVVKLMINKYEGPILPVYFKAFKRFYKKGILISLIYLVFLFLLSFNIYYYIFKMEDVFLWFDFISFIITILVLIISFPALFHSLLIYSCYEDNSLKSILIDGFKLSVAFILRGIIFIIMTFMILYLSLLMPIILIIISVFILLLAIELVLFRGYDKVEIFKNQGIKKAEELSSQV